MAFTDSGNNEVKVAALGGTIRARVGYVLLGDTVEPVLSGHPGNCQETAKIQVDRLRQVAQNTCQTQNHLVNNYLMNKLQR